KALAHDADHRHVLVSELDGAPYYIRIASQPAPPHLKPDDGDRWRASLFVSGGENTTHQRRGAGDAKPRRAHLSDLHRTGIAVGHNQIAVRVAPGAEVRDRSQPVAPGHVVVEETFLVCVCGDVDHLNLDDAVARGER